MQRRIVLKVSKALTPMEELREVSIIIEGNKIKEVVPWDEIPRNEDVLDFSAAIAAPGFIDIHIHGCYGHDVTFGREEDLRNISNFLLRHGVTSFIPTTMTVSQSALIEACKTVRNVIEGNRRGAEILGLHLEGPHVSREKAGAQNLEFVRNPSIEELEELVKASGDNIKRITLAPELPGAIEYIKHAKELGITIAAGHSYATYEEAVDGFNAGITLCNHFYNGMREFHHREPGIIGACLTRDDVYVEMIPDMIHVHPAAIELAIKAKGLEKVILITDAIPATGLPDGEYELGGLKTVVKDGISRVKATGGLAGSTVTMDVAVKNVVSKLKLNLKDAIKMIASNPADALNLPDRGRLTQGSIANLVILDSKINVLATIVGGEVLYRAT